MGEAATTRDTIIEEKLVEIALLTLNRRNGEGHGLHHHHVNTYIGREDAPMIVWRRA